MANRSVSGARQLVRNFSTGLKFTGNGETVELGTANPFTGSFYFATWFFWHGPIGNWQQIFNKRDGYALGSLMFSMSLHTSTSQLIIDNIAGSINWGYYPKAGKNTHMIWVHDVSANTDNLYINGSLFSSVAKKNLGNGTSALISIGSCQHPATESFNGRLDETAIGTTTLTVQQAADIYFKGVFPQNSLWTLLKYNEGSGTTANDSSGNGNNGTITSATYITSSIPASGVRTLI